MSDKHWTCPGCDKTHTVDDVTTCVDIAVTDSNENTNRTKTEIDNLKKLYTDEVLPENYWLKEAIDGLKKFYSGV